MPGPTPEFLRHHDVEAPRVDELAYRPFWRRRTKLDRLLLDGAIPPATWQAAMRFRRDVEALQRGNGAAARYDDAGGSSRPAGSYAPRIDARIRLGAIRRALGAWTFSLLEVVIVEDVSWAELGERLGVEPKTAKSWAVAALAALAAYQQQPVDAPCSVK